MRRLLLSLLALLAVTGAAWAQTPDPYAQGVCAGLRLTTEALLHNRDAWRALLHLPPQALADGVWESRRLGPEVPVPTEAEHAMRLLAQTVDLYLVLPPLQAGQRVVFVLEDGRRVA